MIIIHCHGLCRRRSIGGLRSCLQVETALSIAERLLSIGEICRSAKRVKDVTPAAAARKEYDEEESDSDTDEEGSAFSDDDD